MRILKNKLSWKLGSILLLICFYAFLYKILIPRITAFGCMDDCNNFMGGYFLLHGKALFSQIFFNHAPFMAHLSEFVFWVTRPQNLYEIILRHRQFVMLFGLASEAVLILRFGPIAFPFALFYELTKFYIGGDRFLAEGFVVYPMSYMIGIVFQKFIKQKVWLLDYFVGAVAVWFVLFIREPYSLAVLFLFGALLWGKGEWKEKRFAVGLAVLLCVVTFFSYNPSEFFYNVVYVNKTNLAAENDQTGFFGINIYKSFVYPFIIFFQGEWNFMRYIEMGLAGVFLFANALFIWKRKWKAVIFLWIVLGLANIRFVVPGHEYYGAFHLLPWYAMTILTTLLMLQEIWHWKKVLSIIGFSALAATILYLILSKGSYLHDKIDEHTEFITNYGNELQVGNVVAALSSPKDSLFLDGSDDIIYLVSNRYSSYPYSWYTSLMPQYKKYTNARMQMLATNPPDFYYKACDNKNIVVGLPKVIESGYIRLYNLQNPSCLWMKKSKIASISQNQWEKAGESLYFLQPHSR